MYKESDIELELRIGMRGVKGNFYTYLILIEWNIKKRKKNHVDDDEEEEE